MRRRRLGRVGLGLSTTVLGLFLAATPALACGGLIGPNGAVNLLRTSTLAAYHDGVEHYVTAFEFAGGGGAFGSITPLPGIPTTVEKGGDWTLQRLVRETTPVAEFDAARLGAASPSASGAVELQKVTIDALDLTVLKGGAAHIGIWGKDHGLRVPPPRDKDVGEVDGGGADVDDRLPGGRLRLWNLAQVQAPLLVEDDGPHGRR